MSSNKKKYLKTGKPKRGPGPLARNPDTRIGLRLGEFATAIGLSPTTIWRRVKNKEINVARIGGAVIIPRKELIRLGLLSS